MSFLLQRLPKEILGEISNYLDLRDVLNLLQCVDFDVPAATYHRIFPYDCVQERYTVKSFQERAGARAYFVSDEFEPKPVGLGESIVKMAVSYRWDWFLTGDGDIWFTTYDMEKIYKETEKKRTGKEPWLFRNGLVRLRGEDMYLQEPETVAEEWKRRYPDTLRPMRRKFVDVCPDPVSMVDSTGVSSVFFDENPPFDEKGWFHGICDIVHAGTDGYVEQKAPWMLEKALRTQSDSVLYEGKGIATNTGRMYYDNRCVDVNVLFPKTASGVKDWVRSLDLLIILRTDGTVDVADVPSPDEIHDSEVPMDFQVPPDSIQSLPEINTKGPFVQICSRATQVALVTATGNIVVLVVGYDSLGIHVLEGLPKFASVALGLHHWLAMTRDGDVYLWHETSWAVDSLEPEFKPPRNSWIEDEYERQILVMMDEPVKVALPGKAYYIAAANDRSIVVCGE